MGRRFSLRFQKKKTRTEQPQSQNAFIKSVILIRNEQKENSIPCFKLVDDCWEYIFESMSIQDILNLSKTCVEMQRICGNYLSYFFPKFPFRLIDNRIIATFPIWDEINRGYY